MIKRRIVWAFTLCIALGLGVVEGQGGSGSEPIAGELPDTHQTRAMTPAERRQFIGATKTYQEKLGRKVERMLRSAQQSGDEMRITCLQDKAVSVREQGNSLQDRVKEYEAAPDNEKSSKFGAISVIAQRLSLIETEATECVGETFFVTATTELVTVQAPLTATYDPYMEPPPLELESPEAPFIPPPESPIF